jgi:hypothetical protein
LPDAHVRRHVAKHQTTEAGDVAMRELLGIVAIGQVMKLLHILVKLVSGMPSGICTR